MNSEMVFRATELGLRLGQCLKEDKNHETVAPGA